jgi:hypothetical protein
MDSLLKWSAAFTIIGVIINAILTGIVIYLMKRDKEKTKSLQQLEQQTETLQQSLREIIKPSLSVTEVQHIGKQYNRFSFKNLGGSCFNLRFEKETFNGQYCYVQMPEIYAIGSHTIFTGELHNKTNEYSVNRDFALDCYFTDIQGRQYRQVLIFKTLVLVTVADLYFTPPELIE